MRLVFAEPAAQDLTDIIDYIALDSPGAAESVFRAIISATESLTDFPNIARTGRLPGTRELSVPALPYVIVYQVAVETITVVAVFHRTRDLARALRERQKGI